MINTQYIEIIYVSSNNKIIKSQLEYKNNLTLKEVVILLLEQSIFSEKFLTEKTFGCFGEKIEPDYIVKEGDRIEILDKLKMTPNEKRKFNFTKI
ncbi:RnfH family protein [Gammaproteobacteria bacterium]|jgi:putative ubiquitin-RnfH superfamily antitoxin RatB of RatAB toxin-antitoxin module|nr:RnfH family protein [Gammaproteobacteria bacterium]|tara:strand:- start:297 stop:581 length:285 start_codon:yes stop_codon:yes gene_type:complete